MMESLDFIFVLPNYRQSKGAQEEIKLAQQLNIPVFYSLNELKKYRVVFNKLTKGGK